MTPDDLAARLKELTAIPAKQRTIEQRGEILDLRAKRAQQTAAKLSRQRAALTATNRKARTRELIELGALVAKAELDNLDAATLLGLLLDARDRITDNPADLPTLKARGGRMFNADRPDTRRPLLAKLPDDNPPQDVRTALKALRLRWSPVLRHWEGVADPDAVRALVQPLGGSVTLPTAS